MKRRLYSFGGSVCLFTGLILNAACIDRGHQRTQLHLDNEYAYTAHRVCAGAGINSDERQHLLGAKAGVQYEARFGVSAQAKIGVLRGWLAGYEGGNPHGTGYNLGTVDASVAFDSEVVGVNVSLSSAFDGSSDFLMLPGLGIRLGNLRSYWMELGFGPFETPFDGRVVYLGLAGRGSWIEFQAGVSAHATLMRTLVGEYEKIVVGGPLMLYAECEAPASAFAVYGNVSLKISDGWSLRVGAQLGELPSFRLGLAYSI